VEDRKQINPILLDFSIAFDEISHKQLYYKLHYYTVCHTTMRCMYRKPTATGGYGGSMSTVR